MSRLETNRTKIRIFMLYHLPVILYAVAIIVVSSISNLKPPDIHLPALDKVAHLVEYAVFAALVFRSLSQLGRNHSLRWVLTLSALFVSIFAALDELYQHFVPGRHTDAWDLTIDILGALLVLLWLGYRHRNRTGDKTCERG